MGVRNSSRKMVVLQRREKVAKLYLEHLPQRVIAQRVKASLATVHRDIKAVEKLWREQAVASVDMVKAANFERCETIYGESMREWGRSKRAKKKTSTSAIGEINVVDGQGVLKQVPAKSRQLIETIQRDGNPHYLQMALKAVAEENKMMGVYEAETGAGGDVNLTFIQAIAPDVRPWNPDGNNITDRIGPDRAGN